MAYEWTETFLATLRSSPNVSAAARAAGVSRQMVYQHRAEDEVFRAAWDDALEEATDELVGECYDRAKDGYEVPVFYMGNKCGRKVHFSDQLAMFLLRAHRAAVYGDRSQVDLTSGGERVRTIFYLPENGRDGGDPRADDRPAGGPPGAVPRDGG